MGKIVEGAWDCAYCGRTQIGGSLRECPGCGHPRDKNVKFYMPKAKKYVNVSELKSTAEDWLCPYCNALNSAAAAYCESCGAPKAESTESYFSCKPPESSADVSETMGTKGVASSESDLSHCYPEDNSTSYLLAEHDRYDIRPFAFVLVIISFIALLVWALLPKNKTITIATKSWERSVQVEEYRAVNENDWYLPSGAYNVSTRQEIRTYDQVLDHYETRTREVSEQVFDGYDTYTTYRDMGNGFFEEEEHQTPRYRTEWHTETYEEPVYVSVPVYGTKYYYTIDKWVYARTETASGGDNEPYFPKLMLEDAEREGTKQEKYQITTDKDKTYQADYDTWAAMDIGETYHVTVTLGQVRLVQEAKTQEWANMPDSEDSKG